MSIAAGTGSGGVAARSPAKLSTPELSTPELSTHGAGCKYGGLECTENRPSTGRRFKFPGGLPIKKKCTVRHS